MLYKYPFSSVEEEDKLFVWNKGKKIVENGTTLNPSAWRRDICGNKMKFSDHGNTDSNYGWEIDHIYPSSRGGTDELSNLQPLQWENNRKKSNTYPWSC